MQFEIIASDITRVSADAIVLPANPALLEGSGTSAAIYGAAGRRRLTAACADVTKKYGRIADGCAVPTPAFDLPAGCIIHAIVPRWRGGDHDEYARLSSAYLSSLYGADQLGCKSIAFPLLASGNNGFDLRLAFDIARESIEQYEPEQLERVILVLYGSHTVAAVRSWGYEVTECLALAGGSSPLAVPKDEFAKLGRRLANIATSFAQTALDMSLEWLENPENQRVVIERGAQIARAVLLGQ